MPRQLLAPGRSRFAITGVVAAILAWVVCSSFRATATGDNKGAGVALGEALFQKRCSGCHSLDKDKEGPRLRGVFGRRAASVPNFSYSDALKHSDFIWNAEKLDQWLAGTDRLVPDNDMDFHVGSKDERQDIILYLQSLSDNQQTP